MTMVHLRMLVAAALVCLAGFAGTAGSQENREAEIRALHSRLNLIQQQQQSLYQEFHMLLELQRQSLIQADKGLINYDDAARSRQERETRIGQYASELNASYQRYRALEEQKAPLVERLNELMQPR